MATNNEPQPDKKESALSYQSGLQRAHPPQYQAPARELARVNLVSLRGERNDESHASPTLVLC